MGIKEKFNRWRGFYEESVTPRQELMSFPLRFDNFEDFAGPFARSMSMELFKAKTAGGAIEPGVPFILWGDRPASDEYVYIYYTEELGDEELERFQEGLQAFLDGLDNDITNVVITLVCVEKSSDAFEKHCKRIPYLNGFYASELVVGIDFGEKVMNTGILTNCPGEKNVRDLRKEFLRMIRVAENYFKG